MFGFSKVKPSSEKVAAFCEWFIANNGLIIESVEKKDEDRNRMFAMLDEVEAQLALVYRDGYRGTIEFDYGFNGEKWDLNLYHKNKRFLKEATEMITAGLNSTLGDKWSVNPSR